MLEAETDLRSFSSSACNTYVGRNGKNDKEVNENYRNSPAGSSIRRVNANNYVNKNFNRVRLQDFDAERPVTRLL